MVSSVSSGGMLNKFLVNTSELELIIDEANSAVEEYSPYSDIEEDRDVVNDIVRPYFVEIVKKTKNVLKLARLTPARIQLLNLTLLGEFEQLAILGRLTRLSRVSFAQFNCILKQILLNDTQTFLSCTLEKIVVRGGKAYVDISDQMKDITDSLESYVTILDKKYKNDYRVAAIIIEYLDWNGFHNLGKAGSVGCQQTVLLRGILPAIAKHLKLVKSILSSGEFALVKDEFVSVRDWLAIPNITYQDFLVLEPRLEDLFFRIFTCLTKAKRQTLNRQVSFGFQSFLSKIKRLFFLSESCIYLDRRSLGAMSGVNRYSYYAVSRTLLLKFLKNHFDRTKRLPLHRALPEKLIKETEYRFCHALETQKSMALTPEQLQDLEDQARYFFFCVLNSVPLQAPAYKHPLKWCDFKNTFDRKYHPFVQHMMRNWYCSRVVPYLGDYLDLLALANVSRSCRDVALLEGLLPSMLGGKVDGKYVMIEKILELLQRYDDNHDVENDISTIDNKISLLNKYQFLRYRDFKEMVDALKRLIIVFYKDQDVDVSIYLRDPSYQYNLIFDSFLTRVMHEADEIEYSEDDDDEHEC